MQVNCTDKRSDRIKGGWHRGINRAEESVRNMARNKGTLDAHIDPSNQQVGEVNPPVFFAFVDVGLKNKTVDPILLPEIPLVVLTIMFISDFGVETKEGRKE